MVCHGLGLIDYFRGRQGYCIGARQPYLTLMHDDVIKWKHFPRYWPFVRGIHRTPVHRWIPRRKGSDGELWCFLWSAPWINGWEKNCEVGDLRRHRAHYDVIVIGYGYLDPMDLWRRSNTFLYLYLMCCIVSWWILWYDLHSVLLATNNWSQFGLTLHNKPTNLLWDQIAVNVLPLSKLYSTLSLVIDIWCRSTGGIDTCTKTWS